MIQTGPGPDQLSGRRYGVSAIPTKRSLSLLPIMIGILVSCGPDIAVTDTKSKDRGISSKLGETDPAPPDVDELLEKIRVSANNQNTYWIPHVEKLKEAIGDLAFQQQKLELQSFYDDGRALREEHSSALARALAKRDLDAAQRHFLHVAQVYARIGAVNAYIKALPSYSREHALDSIHSNFKAITRIMERHRPIVKAYLSAGEQVHARYRVDLETLTRMDDRVRELPQAIANYTSQGNFIAAYVATIHADMFVWEISLSIIPFEEQIYKKSHVGR